MITDAKGNKIRVYIAGKISGINQVVAENNFKRAEILLTKLGFQAINPYERAKRFKDYTYEDYILNGIELLFSCQAICLLPNWQDSQGALLEEHYARVCQKHILFYDNLVTVFPKEIEEIRNGNKDDN